MRKGEGGLASRRVYPGGLDKKVGKAGSANTRCLVIIVLLRKAVYNQPYGRTITYDNLAADRPAGDGPAFGRNTGRAGRHYLAAAAHAGRRAA